MNNEIIAKAVCTVINKLFSDGFAHSLSEIVKVASEVTVMETRASEKFPKVIKTGFNIIAAQHFAEIALEAPSLLKLNTTKAQYPGHHGRWPEFWVIKINPKLIHEDNPRVCTPEQVSIALDKTRKGYLSEKESKRSDDFKRIKEVKEVTYEIQPDKLDGNVARHYLQKQEVQSVMPAGVRINMWTMPPVKALGSYPIKIKFSKDMEHTITLVVKKKEEKKDLSLSDMMRELIQKAEKEGLRCKITFEPII